MKKPFWTVSHRSKYIFNNHNTFYDRVLFVPTVRKISFVELVEPRKAFSRKAAGREDFFYIWGSWGLTRTGLALVDRPSRANRASFLLLAHHRVVSCQGQGSSLEPDLFPTGATGPATWDIPDDLGPHGQFARSIPSQMGPYRRLINHQVTRPLLYGHGIHCSSTISLFGDRESAPSFYSPRLGACFEAILVVYPPLASFYRWKFRVEEEIHVKKSVKRRLEFASIEFSNFVD